MGHWDRRALYLQQTNKTTKPPPPPAMTKRLALPALLLLPALLPGQGSLTVPKTQAWRLHESVRHEVEAAIHRGRAFLAVRQNAAGRWQMAPDHESIVPALAFCDGATVGDWRQHPVLPTAVAAAVTTLEHDLHRVLSDAELAELAYAGLLLQLLEHRPDLVGRVARRLALTDQARLETCCDLIVSLALRSMVGDPVQDFEWSSVLARATRLDKPSGANVAQAGLARVLRGAGADGRAARAYLKWLGRKSPATAEDAWWTARFVALLPPAVLFEEEYPLDWRQRLAARLVARQRRDGATGHGFWGSGEAPDAIDADVLRETTFAILTFVFVAE